MIKHSVKFQDLPVFHSLIQNYLIENDFKFETPEYPDLDSFSSLNTKEIDRNSLSKILLEQNTSIDLSDASKKNIVLLKDENTFTITTGHQLCLLTGPLYFVNKICSTIALVQQLNHKFPEKHFVPVYWMATEDHDFEEVNHFNVFGKKYTWNNDLNGAVGKMKTEGITSLLENLKNDLNLNEKALDFLDKSIQAYKIGNLTEATRSLVNGLFANYGLVIIDGDDRALKKDMIPFFQKELLTNTTFDAVSEVNKQLEKAGFKVQVNPREINLFYLQDNNRNRIVEKENLFAVLNTNITFSKEEIINELKTYPERFSPNVLLRPLFQEVVLPNIAYIGGGGEISYWLQLKSMFEKFNVDFPKLLVRDSAVFISKKTENIKNRNNLNWSDFFKPTVELTKDFANKENSVNFEELERKLIQFYSEINSLFDKSMEQTIEIEKKKSLKGLTNIQKKELKNIKQKNEVAINQLLKAKNQLFPNGNLQERFSNYLELLATFDSDLIDLMINNMNPLDKSFHFFVQE